MEKNSLTAKNKASNGISAFFRTLPRNNLTFKPDSDHFKRKKCYQIYGIHIKMLFWLKKLAFAIKTKTGLDYIISVRKKRYQRKRIAVKKTEGGKLDMRDNGKADKRHSHKRFRSLRTSEGNCRPVDRRAHSGA